jgi:hypothetical protein
LTLPGKIEEPGSLAGKINSPIPRWVLPWPVVFLFL